MNRIFNTVFLIIVFVAPIHGVAQESNIAGSQSNQDAEVFAALKELAQAPKFGESISNVLLAATLALPTVMIDGLPPTSRKMTDHEQKKYGFETRKIISETEDILKDSEFRNSIFRSVLMLYGKRLSVTQIRELTTYYLSEKGTGSITLLPLPIREEVLKTVQDALKDQLLKTRNKKIVPNSASQFNSTIDSVATRQSFWRYAAREHAL